MISTGRSARTVDRRDHPALMGKDGAKAQTVPSAPRHGFDGLFGMYSVESG